MKRVVCGICIGLAMVAGCATENGSAHDSDPVARATAAVDPPARSGNTPATSGKATAAPSPAPSENEVIAHINGEPILMKQLIGPLIEAHGLNMLVNLVQLEIARQDAAKVGITVSPADFQEERKQTLDKLFKESDDKTQEQIDAAVKKKDDATARKLRGEIPHDHEVLLDQFLSQKNISPAEFDIVLQLNTYMRKMAEPAVARSITDESLHAAFNQLYGETVRVSYIQLRTPLEVAAVQRRLANGEKFEDLAEELSTNRASAAMKGQLPAFSRQTPGLPENFKEVAFGLKIGQVSDIVEANGAYHLIKLEDRIPPKVVKFEQQREVVRKYLFERAMAATVKSMRESLGEQAIANLKIDEPVLKKQFDDRIQQRKNQIRDQQKIREEMDRQHQLQTTRPATLPHLLAPQTAPASAPPATQPAAGFSP